MAAATARTRASIKNTNKKINKAGADAPAAPVPDARQAVADEKIAVHVDRLVASCPPLTPEQIDRLSLLLRGVTA